MILHSGRRSNTAKADGKRQCKRSSHAVNVYGTRAENMHRTCVNWVSKRKGFRRNTGSPLVLLLNLVAEACNHPNLQVMPFSWKLAHAAAKHPHSECVETNEPLSAALNEL